MYGMWYHMKWPCCVAHAGLCRTCEIFGVSKFVMSSLRHVDDRTFENLSVSSHKWIHIDEVSRPYHWDGLLGFHQFPVPMSSLYIFTPICWTIVLLPFSPCKCWDLMHPWNIVIYALYRSFACLPYNLNLFFLQLTFFFLAFSFLFIYFLYLFLGEYVHCF